MDFPIFFRLPHFCAISGLLVAVFAAATPMSTPAAGVPISIPGHECEPLPVGELSDADLKRLVPDNSPGRVRVRWATESQDNVFGFNVMRASEEGGEFTKINRSVIPGEGTTNMPMAYCYLDTSAERGKTYWYYIEEVTLDGQRKAIEETKGKDGKGTRVTVRRVDEERTWLRERALQASKAADAPTTTTPAASPTTPTVSASSTTSALETRITPSAGALSKPVANPSHAKALGAAISKTKPQADEVVDPLE